MSGPVFVVGYMHSGTTLMYRILGRNRSVFSGEGESKFFELLPALRAQFPDLSEPARLRALVEYTVADIAVGFSLPRLRGQVPAEQVLTASEVDSITRDLPRAASHGDVFRVVMEHLARRAGRSRWLEKTPTHVFHVDEIVAAVPDARFIEITRDPRDVLASKKTRRTDVWTSERYRDEQRAYKHLEKAYDPFWDALSWKAAIQAGERARAMYPGRVHHIAYEDLVGQPEATVRGFCEFLSLDFDPAMLEVTLGTSADWGARPESRGIYTQSVGRWQKTLSEPELALVQVVLARELAALGYERLSLSARAHAAALEQLLASQGHLFVRLYRRWKMGGPAFVKNVAQAYARRLGVLVRR